MKWYWGVHLLPFLLSAVGIGGMIWNFICSIFITKNASITQHLPSISEFSGKFPERAVFSFSLNVVCLLFFIISYHRFVFLRTKKMHGFFNVVFMIITTLNAGSLSLVGTISMFDELVTHDVVAMSAFFLLFLFHLTWFIHDLWLRFKRKENHIGSGVLIARGVIVCVLLVFEVGIFISIGLLIGSNRKEYSRTLFAVIEYIYVLLNMSACSTYSYDVYHQTKYLNRKLNNSTSIQGDFKDYYDNIIDEDDNVEVNL